MGNCLEYRGEGEGCTDRSVHVEVWGKGFLLMYQVAGAPSTGMKVAKADVTCDHLTGTFPWMCHDAR
jgi:hypothetical protein